VQTRFLFGPAGSGKTFRCLEEIREELLRAPEGPDLILLAPKQATFQLERQLLGEGSVLGYTRLQILSFERLAAYVFDRLRAPLPELLSEEGRVMVLRALLETLQPRLQVFRASARLSGFARQLSVLLRELQRRRLGPESLLALPAKDGIPASLGRKLSDLGLIHRAYLDWVDGDGHAEFEDAPRLLDRAVEVLRTNRTPLELGGLWLDGFAEMTPQEQELLAAILPHCRMATLAFCLPGEPRGDTTWLSPWAVVAQTARECRVRVSNIDGMKVMSETIERTLTTSRFRESPLLAQVEAVMGGEFPLVGHGGDAETGGVIQSRSSDVSPDDASSTSPLRLVECAHPEAEAVFAAREILEFVQQGGRFRDCAVLVRSLDGYQAALRRVLTRFEIPFFLDRREPVAHHPLAELTRFALRSAAFNWPLEEWLGALKTGLTGLSDEEVDYVENAALARGWEGHALWLHPLPLDDDLHDRNRLEALRSSVIGPFEAVYRQLLATDWAPSGAALAGLIRGLWSELKVERQLYDWEQAIVGGAVHATVWDQMNDWVNNLERAFRQVTLPLREWLQILEAGLSGLTIGVIPPALDQVLVGSVDRSRNPDLKLVLVLGMNESVFPAPPPATPLLSETDLTELETRGIRMGPGRRRFGHERYLGYIALTRARQQVIATWAAADVKGQAQNPSRLVYELRRAFRGLEQETFNGILGWSESRHASELAGALLSHPEMSGLESLRELSGVRPVLERWEVAVSALKDQRLSANMSSALYGKALNLSVSALEVFAACPFKFFISHGLKARERDEFDVDSRQTGSFQHEVLAEFHRRVLAWGKPWHVLEPPEAVRWVREIGEEQLESFEHGLFLASASRKFQARALLANLERVVTTLTLWSRQNRFQPAAVEVSFGLHEDGWPAWSLELGKGRSVRVRGRVDRVDLLPIEDGGAAVAILDYKSGGKSFAPLKFENGLQLQLPAYLTAICENPGAKEDLSVQRLRPAGVFFVGLRARPQSAKTRADAAERGEAVSAAAFQHLGRFDASLLRELDSSGARKGEQFKFKLKKDNTLSKTGTEALPSPVFAELLENASRQIRELAGRILEGQAEVSPYRDGQEVACGLCKLRPVCRFDSWTQSYRSLRRERANTGCRKEGVE
jgi:ATP-dependent helicase/nuclease subunit B